ncbi:SDR family NAD(P)-dependent oxidoreductase [Alkalihalobacillus deserti]|uniref:SDR family NAD(P)-dependent oxidoreductase n=1 Tax=Alkalihalobacillus deserti TaxID=2879466 RepID=UPI001D152B3B|nr:3-oxoacyl-ACP reductase FabG [Alkalihalobacillus deserti]
MNLLDGRVALITGGSKGIGKEIARTFSSQRATVYIIDLDEKALNETKEEFANDGLEIATFKVNVCDKEKIDDTFQQIANKHGNMDILVNNAGVIRDNLFFKMTEEDWDTVMNVHVKGSYFCSQIAQKYMVREQYGRIINISSTSALGKRGQANYSTAKAGIQGFTKTLAIELGRYGITVNAIAPGFIETEMTKATAKRLGLDFEDLIERNKNTIPVGRTGKPADIANAALFFALEASSFVSGQVLYVAGGPRT